MMSETNGKGGHEQTATEHAGLDEHAEFTRDVPCVDGLHDGLIVTGELGKVHDLRAVDERPPVQILPVVGGEVAENGVGALDIGTGGMGGRILNHEVFQNTGRKVWRTSLP